jgi:hypothetical protein
LRRCGGLDSSSCKHATGAMDATLQTPTNATAAACAGRERERRPDWTPGFVTTVVGKCPLPSESRGSEMPSQLLPPFCTVPVRTPHYHLKNMF